MTDPHESELDPEAVKQADREPEVKPEVIKDLDMTGEDAEDVAGGKAPTIISFIQGQ
jgi:hypothetical protein